MKTRSLIRKLATFYPKRLREKYDFGGLEIGRYKEETTRIFLALDFDESLLGEVSSFHPDLIITHHPFFFGKASRILETDGQKKRCYDFLLKERIPLASYHTNFDRATFGMNDALAEALELENIKPLEGDDMARGGALKKSMPIEEFVSYALEKLNASYGGLIGEGKKNIRSVAIIGGGGSRSYKAAIEEGYDIFLSGDCPHHIRREIILSHYNYLDLPHEIESIFIDRMTNILLTIDHSLTIKGIKHEKPWSLCQRDSK